MMFVRRRGLTAVEILVVVAVMSVVTLGLYRFFNHYTRTYLRVDDRMAHVVEAWQVLRYLGDDLQAVDFPAGDRARWRDVLQETADGYEMQVRAGGSLQKVVYRFDAAAGKIWRTSGGKTHPVLRNSGQEFAIAMDAVDPGPTGEPRRLDFRVRLVLKNPTKMAEAHKALEVSTSIVPEFLNRRLAARYVHTDL